MLKHSRNVESITETWRESWIAKGGLKEMWNGYGMLVAKGEPKLLEDSVKPFEAKHWCKCLTLADTLFT